MSQKRKAYKDMKEEILNRLCASYEAATSKAGLDLIRTESKTRIQNKSLIRLLDTIYMEMAILTTKTEVQLRKIS